MITTRRRRRSALLLVSAVALGAAVVAPSITQAAFTGTVYETDFEIDGNLTADPGGVDWDNATASGIRDVSTSAGSGEACNGDTAGADPANEEVAETTQITPGTELDDLDIDGTWPIEEGSVPRKTDLCKVTIGWELVDVGGTYHTILYGSWSRPDVQGEIDVLIPLLGDDPDSVADDRVLAYNFQDSQQDTELTVLRWTTVNNKETWAPSALDPTVWEAETLHGQTDPDLPDQQLLIGEFAVNLTLAGFLPADGPCVSFTTAPFISRTGNSPSSTLKDVVGTPPVTLTNCGTIEVVKDARPVPVESTSFTYAIDQRDQGGKPDDQGYPIEYGQLVVPDAPSVTHEVPISPDYFVAEGQVPDGWEQVSLVCETTDPISGQPLEVTFFPFDPGDDEEPAVGPQIPVGPGGTTTCTIVNVGPPTLTLAKVTTGAAGGPFTLEADIWREELDTAFADRGAAATETLVSQLTTTEVGVAVSESFQIEAGDVVAVSETQVGAGFTQVSLVCEVTDIEGETTTVSPEEFSVQAGDRAVCTATNRLLQADLSLQKLVNGDDADAAPGVKVDPGQRITYAVQIANAGPDAAVDAVVTDPIPAGLTDVAVIDDGPYSCAVAAGTLTCTIPNHPVGVTATVTLEATVAATAAGGATITNTATVTSATPDPTPANNTDPAVITVKSADLGVTKSPDGAQVASGGSFQWTITVTNAGPDDAANVVLSDPLPASIASSTSVVDDGPYSCAIAAGTLTCTIANHPVGVTATIVLSSTAPTASSSGPIEIVNVATVSATTPDPNPANNSDPGSVTVPQAAQQPPPPAPPTTVPPAPAPPAPAPELPATGGEPGSALRYGLLLAGLGATALGLSRRRRRTIG